VPNALWRESDSGALPGGAHLQQIVNGITAIVLVGATIGGAVWWAGSQAGGIYNGISAGKRMVLIAALWSIIVGGAAALINHGWPALGRTTWPAPLWPLVVLAGMTVAALAVPVLGDGRDA
jgi:hypothetical protein